MNDGNNLPFSFDDIYYSQSDNSGNILHKGTVEHEGGFSNRTNDLGGATNYGITQSSLNEYNSWNSPLKKGVDFPQNVKLLTPEQSKQIMDEMYYRRYGINNLNGWYNRVQSYYSNPLEFEKLYKNKVDYYINRKYPQYYNGK